MYAVNEPKALKNALAIIVFLTASLVIYGWFLNIPALKSVMPNYISMKLNTALCFILLSTSVMIEGRDTKSVRGLFFLLNAIVILVAALSYAQEILNADFGIDQFIMADTAAIAANAPYPGRMSPITSVMFIIIAVSLSLMKLNRNPVYLQYALPAVTLVSLIAIIGYIFHAPDFYTLNFMTSMAVNTSAAFFLLSLSASLINANLGLSGIFIGNQIGNIMARRLFLLMFGATIIFSMVQYLGHKKSLVSIEFNMALFAVVSIMANIFIIWQTTDQLNKKDTKKRMAEEKFRLVVESVPSALVKSDGNGTIVMVNKQAEKMFGYDREHFVGKKIEVLVPRNISPHHHKNRESFNANPESRFFGAGRDLYAVKSDGSEFPVEIGLNPITTENGEMVLASIIDITERKMQETIIAKQMIELQLKNEEMEQFNYIASHDLQEPLRTLSNYIMLIEEDYEDELSDDVKMHLKTMDMAVSRMSLLVRSILDFGRLGRDKVLVSADCGKIVENVIEDLGSLIKNTGATVEIDGVLPTLNVYETELRQLFQNLINNAVKFRREGIPPHITIGSTKNGMYYEFYIKDNGIGISNKHYDRIFQIFQRLNKQDQYEGHGIGLANCRKIAEMHGGKIWVESVQGSGSTFKFTISTFKL